MSDVTQLKKGKIVYDSLVTKYKDFMGPTFTVKIDNQEISSSQMQISSLNLTTSIERADSFTMEITGAYDFQAKAFKHSDKIKLGKEVQILLGYVDNVVIAFYGYITNIKYEAVADDDIKIIVSGMDKTIKLMKGVKSRSFLKKKHSEIISTLASEAGLTPKVDATSTMYESVEQIGMSDYSFMQALAEKNNYEVFVSGNELHFRKLHQDTSANLTLDWAESIINFSREDDLVDQPGEITVRGWDPMKKEAVVGTCSTMTAIGSGTSGKSLLSSVVSGVKEYYYSEVKSAVDAKTLAESIYYRRAMRLVSGRITSIGIPEIRAGIYVGIKGIDTDLDHTYYIVSASHEIDENGYVTNMTIGSNVV